jgi:hypothetical protein
LEIHLAEIKIQFSTSKAFSSDVIRRLTHSPFSHVDLIVPEGLLGVSGKDDSIHDLGGVMVRPMNAWPYLTTPKVARLQCADEVAAAVIAAGRSQLGKPFDDSALWSFFQDQAVEQIIGKPRDWRDTKQWFCSEWLIWSVEQGGLFPYELVVAKNRITPADVLLMINGFMSADNILEFAM